MKNNFTRKWQVGRAETKALKMVDWPFEDPENVAVITLKRILRGAQPVLYVSHDEDDGSWQFLDGQDMEEDDATVVSLGNMVKRDLSLKELADLPPGWVAWREGVGQPWYKKQRTE